MIADINNPLLILGSVYELRAPRGRQGTISGYFDNAADLYKAASTYDGQVPGLYVTLNPVNPALLARAKNRLQPNAKTTTSDADIVTRTWLLIDCDAVRPADISSTDAEHHEALSRAIGISEWLHAQGWPEPVMADSGNGAHVLYRIDLLNDRSSRDLVKAVLEVLALRFNDQRVIVDTSVSNAGRITKLYGTMVCKGDSMDNRPHRRSTILQVSEPVTVVSVDRLHSLAALRPVDPQPSRSSRNGSLFDPRDFMSRHGLRVAREKAWNGATVYELDHCPFNPDHVRDSSIIQYPSGAVSFQCFHNSCQSYHWAELRDKLEPNANRQSQIIFKPESGGAACTLVSADNIAMKPVRWSVQGRVPLGMLAVIAGRGGLGKSTVVCEWAAQLSRGKSAGALAGIPVTVIISSTEDSEAETLVPRLKAADADLTRVRFARLRRDGLDGSLTIPDDIEVLREAIRESGARFLVLDPLMAHISGSLNAWNDHEIRLALTPLALLAAECDVSILVVAHLNKDTTKAALDRIGGSSAIGNVARSVLFAGPDPDEPEGPIKMLAHPKCNVGPLQPTLRYRIEPVQFQTGDSLIETTRVRWDGEALGVSADDLVAKPEPLSREGRSQAVDWLERYLPIGTRRKQSEIEQAAAQAGISKWTLKRVKSQLNILSRKEGFAPGAWMWWREVATNNASTLHSSGKTAHKSLETPKGTEGSTSALFVRSSTAEGSRRTEPALFGTLHHISTTYNNVPCEGSSAASYIEEVDLRDS